MKVNVTFPVAGLEQYKATRKKAEVGSATQVSQHDEIAFSKDATLFSDVLKAAKSSISDRLEKSDINIDTIKSKIESGAYEVKAEELADSILMLQGYYERRQLND